MNFSFKSLLIVTATVLASILAGCGDKKVDHNTVTVGVIAGAEAQVAEIAAKIAKDKYDLDVKLVTFTDYVTPNAALDDGSIDINAFQHKPYLDQQIIDRGYKLAIAGHSFVYPIAGYSKQLKSIDELPNNARISVPNDPTNLGRALLLLEEEGLIKLRDNIGLSGTVRDIVDNPKNISIIELDAALLPRSLDDVQLSIINTTYASSIDLTPEKDGIIIESKESPYVNLIVSRVENVEAENVQKFVKAYQTEEVYKAALDIFKGGVVKGWE